MIKQQADWLSTDSSPRSGRVFFGRVLGSCGWELWWRLVKAQVAVFLPFALCSPNADDTPTASGLCSYSQQLPYWQSLYPQAYLRVVIAPLFCFMLSLVLDRYWISVSIHSLHCSTGEYNISVCASWPIPIRPLYSDNNQQLAWSRATQ